MPKKYDRCVRKVKSRIKSGKIPKTYMTSSGRKKTNAYAICNASMRKKPKGKLLKTVNVKGLEIKLYEVKPKGLGAGKISKARMKKLLKGRKK
jgi:hypothetical protein